MKISTSAVGGDPGLRLNDAYRMQSMSGGLPGTTWAYRDFDFRTWSEDDYYGHYWLEKQY